MMTASVFNLDTAIHALKKMKVAPAKQILVIAQKLLLDMKVATKTLAAASFGIRIYICIYNIYIYI